MEKFSELDKYDVLFLVGLGMVELGLWLVNMPAALVMLGGLLFVLAMLRAWWKSKKRQMPGILVEIFRSPRRERRA